MSDDTTNPEKDLNDERLCEMMKSAARTLSDHCDALVIIASYDTEVTTVKRQVQRGNLHAVYGLIQQSAAESTEIMNRTIQTELDADAAS